MITYPRICQICNYSANNPTMWGYHKATHVPIPNGKLCDFGCEQPAVARKTTGRYVCCETSQNCPSYRKQHAARIKKQWATNEWKDRRLKNKMRTLNETDEQRRIRNEKQKKTKREKLLSIADTFGKRQYSRIIIYHSRKTYKIHKETLNPLNLQISRDEYHIDHKVSRHVGYLLKIPIHYMYSEHNLDIMPSKQNSSKSSKCSLHPMRLLELCEASDKKITNLKTKIKQLPELTVLFE